MKICYRLTTKYFIRLYWTSVSIFSYSPSICTNICKHRKYTFYRKRKNNWLILWRIDMLLWTRLRLKITFDFAQILLTMLKVIVSKTVYLLIIAKISVSDNNFKIINILSPPFFSVRFEFRVISIFVKNFEKIRKGKLWEKNGMWHSRTFLLP